MKISEHEAIKLSKFASKATRIVRRDYTFVDILKKILNFAIAFEKE